MNNSSEFLILGLRMGAELLVRENVSAIIGPNCNEACEPLANLAKYSNTPMVSYGCFSYDEKKKHSTPTHVRILPDLMNDVETLAAIYSRFDSFFKAVHVFLKKHTLLGLLISEKF